MKIRALLLTAALLVYAYATTVSQQQSPQPTPTTTPSPEQTTKVRDAKPEEIPFTYDKEIFGNVRINNIGKRVNEPG